MLEYCYSGSLCSRHCQNGCHLQSKRYRAFWHHVFAHQNGVCACDCGRPMEELHHETYQNFGNEKLSDVRGLSRFCHQRVTAEQRRRRLRDVQRRGHANLRNVSVRTPADQKRADDYIGMLRGIIKKYKIRRTRH